MSVFHFFKIVQMVPSRATHHIFNLRSSLLGLPQYHFVRHLQAKITRKQRNSSKPKNASPQLHFWRRYCALYFDMRKSYVIFLVPSFCSFSFFFLKLLLLVHFIQVNYGFLCMGFLKINWLSGWIYGCRGKFFFFKDGEIRNRLVF